MSYLVRKAFYKPVEINVLRWWWVGLGVGLNEFGVLMSLCN